MRTVRADGEGRPDRAISGGAGPPGAQGLAADLRGVTARHVLKHLEEEELTPDRRQPTRQLLFGSVFFLVPEGLSQ